MINTKVGHFPPAKQFGLILHGIIILVLAGASIWGFANLTNAQVGPMFVSYLLIGLLAFAPIPLLGYRAYALFKADYYIDRDSLAILWGLRIEDIPLTDIEWVRPASDLTNPLALPRFRLPGAVLGTRRHPDLGSGRVHCLNDQEHDSDRDFQTCLCDLTPGRGFAGPHFRPRHRIGQPHSSRTKIRLSIFCDYTGLG